MEKGLQVIFDGDKNLVVDDLETYGKLSVYPIGGMICEYLRFRPEELIEIIQQIPHFEDPWEEHYCRSWFWFNQKVKEAFDRIAAVMICTEFNNVISEYINTSDEYREDVLDYYGIDVDNIIKQMDPENDEAACKRIESIGQLFLCGYDLFIRNFSCVNQLFEASYDGNKLKVRECAGFARNDDFQKIGYRIAFINEKFHSIYNILDSMSLFLFESAHLVSSVTKIRKCKNCGHYFVPVGRSDTIYCRYPSPDNPNKSCRDIGAQNTRVRLEKNDIVTSEYRRLYKRLKAAISRHPDDINLEIRLKKLTDGMKDMKNKRVAGVVSSDDILEWLYLMENDM